MPSMRSSKYLVAYDGSESSKRALELAISIAESEPNSEFVFVNALSLPAIANGDDIADQIIQESIEIIHELSGIVEKLNNKCQVKLLKGAEPPNLIVQTAIDENCDFIIIGSRGKGGFKGYLGSVSYAVIQKSPVDVIVAKHEEPIDIKL